MSNPVLDRVDRFIDEKSVVILDGGFSNALAAYNVDFEKSELWTSKVLLDRPDLIKRVHLDYLHAGSDIIETVTYQATFQKLRKFGFTDERIHGLFELSVQLAEQAVDEYLVDYEKQHQKAKSIRPLIAISVGSYGAYRCDGSEYRGDYDLDEDGLVEFHRERIDFIAGKLLKGKHHLIAMETIPSLAEAKALIRLIKQHDNLTAWLSFSCRDERCISDGTPIEQIVELVRDVKQIFAIGVNCVQPEYVEGILQRMKAANSNKRLLIYPNNGDVYDAATRSFVANSSKLDYIAKVSEWKAAYDLAIIGGCCRIGPKEIARIRSFFVQN